MRGSAEELVADSDVVVVSNSSAQFRDVLAQMARPDQVVVDLVRIIEGSEVKGKYYGICW
jgi:wyosine [tRNA(Phe)-imidazoG37] synthetase (radical SAM superfamily)